MLRDVVLASRRHAHTFISRCPFGLPRHFPCEWQLCLSWTSSSFLLALSKTVERHRDYVRCLSWLLNVHPAFFCLQSICILVEGSGISAIKTSCLLPHLLWWPLYSNKVWPLWASWHAHWHCSMCVRWTTIIGNHGLCHLSFCIIPFKKTSSWCCNALSSLFCTWNCQLHEIICDEQKKNHKTPSACWMELPRGLVSSWISPKTLIW